MSGAGKSFKDRQANRPAAVYFMLYNRSLWSGIWCLHQWLLGFEVRRFFCCHSTAILRSTTVFGKIHCVFLVAHVACRMAMSLQFIFCTTTTTTTTTFISLFSLPALFQFKTIHVTNDTGYSCNNCWVKLMKRFFTSQPFHHYQYALSTTSASQILYMWNNKKTRTTGSGQDKDYKNMSIRYPE